MRLQDRLINSHGSPNYNHILKCCQINHLQQTKESKDSKAKHGRENKEQTKQKTSEKLRRQLVALRGN